MRFKFKILVVLLLVSLISKAQFYYGLQQEFGKNRVQYQAFYWNYFDFERYRVYCYEGGTELAKFVSYNTEAQIKEIEKKLDYVTDEKFQILVYNNQNDFQQSNLGLSSEEQSNVGGMTKIVGNKISVYFDGSHTNLLKQIREGIAETLVNEYLYGGRTRDMIKNGTLLVVPEWYKQGLIAYLSEPWNVDVDNRIYDGIKYDKYYQFNRLTGKDAVDAGHSIWYYVCDTYGESMIPNLLYMTKVTRNIENSFNFVLNISSEELIYEWHDSFGKRMMHKDSTRFSLEKPFIENPKKATSYYQIKLSPSNDNVIYVTNQMSQYKVWLHNISTNERKRIAKWGPKIERINDQTYPLLAWHPTGKLFAMVLERKGVITLNTYNVEDGERFSRNITGLKKVIDFAYSDDGKRIVLSGVKNGKGQSDIFIFSINSGGLEEVTSDIFDDNHPRFVNHGNQIVFESNRTEDTIKAKYDNAYMTPLAKHTDIFMYDLKTKSKRLYQITNTPDYSESFAQDFINGNITYLSEANGIRNRYLAKLDSVISYVDTVAHYRYTFNSKAITNYNYNILEQDVNLKANSTLENFLIDGRNYFYIKSIPSFDNLKYYEPQLTHYRRLSKYSGKKSVVQNYSVQDGSSRDTSKIDVTRYNVKVFKNNNTVVVNNEPNGFPVNNDTAKVKAKKEFVLPVMENYYINFSTDYVVTQLDNSFLNLSYQKFTGVGVPVYNNPGMSGFFKVGLSDLFEDYRVTGGFRIAGSLDNEYFVSVENRKKLWDKQLILHRQAQNKLNIGSNEFLKIHTHDAQFKIKYPFSEVSCIRNTLYYRNDRTVYASSTEQNLSKENTYQNWVGLKTEYVFDNTINRGLNLMYGTRLKVFAEYLRQVKLERKDLIVLGFDVRHYQKIHRDFIWANRIAGSTSLGTDRLIYYMGGVDNWFNPKFDNRINVLHPETYGFQTLATNMRGFKQNIRNGNNFVVINSELRFPIFKYLLNRPIKSDFVNNFQIVGFGDVGTAWYGKSPYSEENTINKTYVPGNPVSAVLFEQKDPIVGGYGLGLRSRIFGYFVRLDLAYGIENQVRQKRMIYLSFNTDF